MKLRRKLLIGSSISNRRLANFDNLIGRIKWFISVSNSIALIIIELVCWLDQILLIFMVSWIWYWTCIQFLKWRNDLITMQWDLMILVIVNDNLTNSIWWWLRLNYLCRKTAFGPEFRNCNRGRCKTSCWNLLISQRRNFSKIADIFVYKLFGRS